MTIGLIIILVYFTINILIAFFIKRRTNRNQEWFFLANRKISPFVFFITMAATNFSAFTIFGFSGAGYRMGYAFYPLMAFGTGFMALAFFIIGIPLHKMAREKKYITPADFIADRYASTGFKKMFSAFLILFTMPYLALQIMFAGKILFIFSNIPYVSGCLLVMLVVVSYVCIGGLQTIAWTDVFQGLLIVISVTVAFLLIS
ncbi:MAG: sodium:solute symporter family protein, partial [Deltaproteobacteria bacterium]